MLVEVGCILERLDRVRHLMIRDVVHSRYGESTQILCMVCRNEWILFVIVSLQKRQCQHFEMLRIVLQRCSLLIGNNVSGHRMEHRDNNHSHEFSFDLSI